MPYDEIGKSARRPCSRTHGGQGGVAERKNNNQSNDR